MRRIAIVVVIGLLAGLTGAASAAPTIGQPAPSFSLTLLDGREISLQEFKGKPIVVNFWYSG